MAAWLSRHVDGSERRSGDRPRAARLARRVASRRRLAGGRHLAVLGAAAEVAVPIVVGASEGEREFLGTSELGTLEVVISRLQLFSAQQMGAYSARPNRDN